MHSWSSFLPWNFLSTEQWIQITQSLFHDIDGTNHVTILQWLVPTFFGRTPLQASNCQIGIFFTLPASNLATSLNRQLIQSGHIWDVLNSFTS